MAKNKTFTTLTPIQAYMKKLGVDPNLPLAKEIHNYLVDKGYDVDYAKVVEASKSSSNILYLMNPNGFVATLTNLSMPNYPHIVLEERGLLKSNDLTTLGLTTEKVIEFIESKIREHITYSDNSFTYSRNCEVSDLEAKISDPNIDISRITSLGKRLKDANIFLVCLDDCLDSYTLAGAKGQRVQESKVMRELLNFISTRGYDIKQAVCDMKTSAVYLSSDCATCTVELENNGFLINERGLALGSSIPSALHGFEFTTCSQIKEDAINSQVKFFDNDFTYETALVVGSKNVAASNANGETTKLDMSYIISELPALMDNGTAFANITKALTEEAANLAQTNINKGKFREICI